MTHSDSRRIRLISDAVVASYINDISARDGSPRPRRDDGHGREARLRRTRAALRTHDVSAERERVPADQALPDAFTSQLVP